MSLQEEIQAIVKDASLDFEEKGRRLAKLVTKQELSAILPKPQEKVTLKDPLNSGKTLNLSIHKVYFDSILAGTKPIEYREYKDYYIKKCTYLEDGKRYLVPFETLTLYVGRGSKAQKAIVKVTNITCDGSFIMFHLGKVLFSSKGKQP